MLRLSRTAAPLVGLVTLAGLAVGCHPASGGSMTAAGYQHDSYPYKVVISGGNIGDGWDLDNYRVNGDGNYITKSGDIYETTYLIDANGDGKADAEQKAATYDLRFHNAKHDAVIWLRTIPLSPSLKDKGMGEVALKYIGEIAGSGPEAVQLAGPPNQAFSGKHWESKVADRADLTLGGKEAFVTRLNVRTSPDAKWTGVEVVLVRPGFQETVQAGGAAVQVPVVLVAGYANSADNFTADEPAFKSFLADIDIGGRRGLTAPKPAASTADSDTPAPASSATH
jgi:hypothetical protein